jgi:Domain of unknown function (DUF222)
MRSGTVTARDQVLAELATPGPGPGDALSLLAQARELARFADQVHGELARLIGLIDATGAYAEAGYGSTAAFARHACGRAHARAGELVATGRALRQLGATRTALAAGRVSFDAAHVICRAVSQIGDQTLAAAAEQQMLDAATTGLPGSRTAAEAVGARAGGAPSEAGTGLGSDADMDGGLDSAGRGTRTMARAPTRRPASPVPQAATRTAPTRPIKGPGCCRAWTHGSCAAWVRT